MKADVKDTYEVIVNSSATVTINGTKVKLYLARIETLNSGCFSVTCSGSVANKMITQWTSTGSVELNGVILKATKVSVTKL